MRFFLKNDKNYVTNDDNYVNLPDDPMRGIRPSWMDKRDIDKVECKAYEIGSPVWYITKHWRFDWYVPAFIESYIFSKIAGKREVTAYVLKLEEPKDGRNLLKLHRLARAMTKMKKQLKAADPVKVIRRWEGILPEPPLPQLHAMAYDPTKYDEFLDCNDAYGYWNGDSDDDCITSPEPVPPEAYEKYGKDLGFEGAKQKGVGPEMWGLTLKQIRDVMEDENFVKAERTEYGLLIEGSMGMSMYDVVEKVIKPKTKGKGVGYALLQNGKKPLRAKIMISHAWGEDYECFVKAIETSGEKGPFWVCALSIYQNEDIPKVTIAKQMGPAPITGPFATVLKQASSMLAIITPQCDVYTRLWCVYEMFVAVSLGVPVNLSSYSESHGYGGSGQTFYDAALDSAATMISTASARCSNKDDELMIRNEVVGLDGGFGLLDDVIFWIKANAIYGKQKHGDLETGMHRIVGECTSSCIKARTNAAVAQVLVQWDKSKQERKQQQEQLLPRGCDGHNNARSCNSDINAEYNSSSVLVKEVAALTPMISEVDEHRDEDANDEPIAADIEDACHREDTKDDIIPIETSDTLQNDDHNRDDATDTATYSLCCCY